MCFLAFAGFERPITIIEEAARPQRDMPTNMFKSVWFQIIIYAALSYLMSGLIRGDGALEFMNEKMDESGYWLVGVGLMCVGLVSMIPSIMNTLLS